MTRTRTRAVIPTTSRGVNKVPFDVSHVGFDVSSLCWECGWSTCCYSFLMLLLFLIMYLPLHFMSDMFTCTEVLICEVWFACLCLLLLCIRWVKLYWAWCRSGPLVIWLPGSSSCRLVLPAGFFLVLFLICSYGKHAKQNSSDQVSRRCNA